MKRFNNRFRRKVPVPLASMGDIAFLLIIFFMLLSEFAKDKDLQLELPLSTKIEKPKDPVAARVAIDVEGIIYVDGDRVQSPKDVEWSVKALLNKTVAEEQRHVQFKCDSSLPRETFEPVLKAIVEAGGIIEAVGEEP